MISTVSHNHPFLPSILVSILCILSTVKAQSYLTVNHILYANNKTTPLQSENGDFAFGFHAIPGDEFLLAIWYANIPEKTVVWYGATNKEKNLAVDKESTVELTDSGQLVLKDPRGKWLWMSKVHADASEQVSHAAMLDTGNFHIVSKNGKNMWESFKYPTNTILPTQELDVDGNLLSTLDETSFEKGRYQLRFSEGHLILNQIDMFTRIPYKSYSDLGNGSRLIFNKSGQIQLELDGRLGRLASDLNYPLRPESEYYRATLDFTGVFTFYSHPKNSSRSDDGTWSTGWFGPIDICKSSIDASGELGIGPCGYNSICEPIDGKPNCQCPPGFSFLDENNHYAGCKQNYTSYPVDCNLNGSTNGEDRFEFITMQFVDFPFSDYGILRPATELECQTSCLVDCSCAVAILEDGTVSGNGNGTCWKKKLPLLNGRLDRSSINRLSFYKVLKSSASRTNHVIPDSRNENQNQVTLILSVLLGTSAIFNFFFLAGIALIFFCVFQRRFRDFNGIPSRRDLETNLRAFTFKDLEHATNRFTKEIGRGAFGTVYKGEFSSSYGDFVAVKKLDKFVQEGEQEFKTELKVIGQTHHKNLVRLLGYCDEGEHRLLVYEFMEHGSLSSFLFGKIRPSWQQRLQIASGIAKGLAYLHEECSKQIIHCDIKPQNILLDDDLTAKISDFGLAKLLINNNTRTLTGIRGTKGYVAPEWFRNIPVTVKVDVYSFGVMLLEIICCRRCVEFEMEEAAILADWAYDCYNEGKIEKLAENDEEARNDPGRLDMLVKVAIWCVQEVPLLRPSMRTVSMMLEGAAQVPPPPCPYGVNSMCKKTF